MELRKAGTSLHSIQTIRDGLVVKMSNRNGTPALNFKYLDEIYESRGLKPFFTLNSAEKCVKSDNQLPLPFADRILSENNEFVSCGSGSESDSDNNVFVGMTLKQVKERCKTKKRKLRSLSSIIREQEVFNCDEEEDEDLNVPLSVFKTKVSKTKRECIDGNPHPSSETAISNSTEHIIGPDCTLQLNGESASLVPTVKDEVLEEDFTGNQCIDPLIDCSSFNCDEESSCSGSILGEVPDAVEVQENMTMLFAEEQQCCTLNEMSTNYDLDCAETDIHLIEVEAGQEMCSSQENDITTSPIETISPRGFLTNSSSNHVLKSPEDGGASSLIQLPKYSSADTRNSCLNTYVLQDESLTLKTLEDNKSLDMVDEIIDPSIETQPSNQISSELLQPPQRFPSLRKAISPASQERLCLQMKSADYFDEAEIGIKPVLGQNENYKPSDQACQPRVTIRREQIKRKFKKNSHQGFPHRGNLDGPLFSRSLPQLSSGSASIDSCSNSAIAFSQRQMHDFESLAMKLLYELKSMKDVVEEKLLFKAYRSVCGKNEVDEVRNTINNTKKVEETARKWMSMMSRDCTRFCKLMEIQKQSQNDTTSKGTDQRDRKITFADEAGGMLCSVNYFDAVSSPLLPCGDENQEEQDPIDL
ncbi:unnamed protein product [Cuscuta epithymum]|uniref:Uncharacterized protein n=1 Tax=Cuscuta epithymum TaxID=186058 RepID=A0AAV0ECA6_9ASTE|nr:unnamed protein product [Cuscuta epithymum]